MSADAVKYRGHCLCGQIALEVEGAPLRAFNRLRDDLIAVYAAVVVDSGSFHEAACHIHCDEAVLDLHDDVPKYTGWRDSALMPEPRRTGMRGR